MCGALSGDAVFDFALLNLGSVSNLCTAAGSLGFRFGNHPSKSSAYPSLQPPIESVFSQVSGIRFRSAFIFAAMKSGGDLKSTGEDEEIQLAAASSAAAEEISLDAAVAAGFFCFFNTNWSAFLHFKKNNVVSSISLTLPHHGSDGGSAANISSGTAGCGLTSLPKHFLLSRWKHEINIKDLGDVPSGAPRGSSVILANKHFG